MIHHAGPAGSGFGRRRFLAGALGSAAALTGASSLFAASDFWNSKDPASWNEGEILQLMSKSPWSREAVPTYKHAMDPTGASGSDGMGGRGASLRNKPPIIYVRWESAQPILDALRSPLAAGLEGHYVISVTNLPMPTPHPAGRGMEAETKQDILERIQNGATLLVKGQEPAEAGIARINRIGAILFGFSKELVKLTPADREIFFRLDTGELNLSTKFDGKEMMYHGKLAV